ncbi:MAG: ABC transporter permease subunit [Nitrosomonas sp.]|nr:ABC transporter permease subunit [Nitrosomonas sp.]
MIATIARKELIVMFTSPLAWTLLALMQLVLTWVFLGRLDAFLEIQSQLIQIANPPGITEIIVAPVFSLAAIVLLMVMPLLTMRLLAEERRNNTLVLLFSAPVSVTHIIIGKFLSLLIFVMIMTALLTVLSISLLAGGTLDFGLLLSNALGLLLIAACFSSLGLYISSLTAHPAVAATGALGLLLGLWLLDIVASDGDHIVRHFSLLKHYENFNRGIIDTFSLSYFILFIVSFLILTIHRLDGERLRG